MAISKIASTTPGRSERQGTGAKRLLANDAGTNPAHTNNHEKGNSHASIRSVTKALELLQAICEDDVFMTDFPEEIRVSQLSLKLGLSMNEVSRLMATFESCGFVARDKNMRTYRIGMNAFDMGRKMLTRMTLLRQARPVMEDLARRCNESVYLALPRGSNFLFFDHVENLQPVKIAPLISLRFPLTSASPGRLMLAYSAPGAQLSDDQAGILPVTLKAIKQQGFCQETGGLGDMVVCLAAPIFNGIGTMLGALCLVGPNFRLSESMIENTLLPLLRESSETISSKLGYHLHHTGNTRL